MTLSTPLKLLFIAWALFCLRGFLQIAMVPPLEGFDSIGHIDYLQFLRDHNGARNLAKMSLSTDAAELAGLFPTSRSAESFSISALHGGLPYKEYFARSEKVLDSIRTIARAKPFVSTSTTYIDDEDNWQKKHPPLYYMVLNWIVCAINPRSYFSALYLYALVSLGMASLMLIPLYLMGRRADALSPDAKRPFLPGALLLVVAQPMLYVVGTRISNDALAYPLNALVLALIFLQLSNARGARRFLVMSGVIGLATGLAIIVKTYALIYCMAYPGILAFLALRQRRPQLLIGAAVFLVGALAVSGNTLWYHYTVAGDFEASQMRANFADRGITPDFVGTFLSLFIFSLDGYNELFRTLITYIWVGNWSAIGNYAFVYLPYFTIGALLVYRAVRAVPSLLRREQTAESTFTLFSLVLHAIFVAVITKFAVEWANYYRGELHAVGGYYALAFYLATLLAAWVLLRDVRWVWPVALLAMLAVCDFFGLIAQVVFYYGAGYLGPVKMIVPEAHALSTIARNWGVAPWTIVPLPLWIALTAIYFGVLAWMGVALARQQLRVPSPLAGQKPVSKTHLDSARQAS